ncbi:FGGY-family carbohydrate kinase, partial [Pseudomonas sp.]|uniref:FGGY-family carbohydrate kinase n=1 Tax=Pseudomonas sp. TaxID=306 RepID=UPI0028A9F427
EWARGLGLFRDYGEIRQFAEPPAIARGLVFVPALAGLACPHWQREARGTWQGLSLEHGAADLVQSVLEGVALRMAEVLDAIECNLRLQGALSVDGGLTRNPYFCQFLADVLQRPIDVSLDAELTSLGLALLAAESAGLALEVRRESRRFVPQGDCSGYRQRFVDAVAACRPR